MSLIVYIACFKKSRKYLILRHLQHFDQFHYTPVTSATTIKLQQRQRDNNINNNKNNNKQQQQPQQDLFLLLKVESILLLFSLQHDCLQSRNFEAKITS